MDQPRIQYVSTPDGVSIAYFTLGAGPRKTLFYPLPFSHLEREWQVPALQAAYTLGARDSMVIRIDPRGFGLSERDITDFSVDAMVMDIEAVATQLGLGPFGIYAMGFGCVPAITYAAQHPETTHLVLQGIAVTAEDFEIPRLVAIKDLAVADWRFASETIWRSFNPEWPESMVKDFAELLRASIDIDQFIRFWEAARAWDATDAATAVQTRTLLIHNKNDPNENVRAMRRAGSLIPGAQTVFVSDVFDGQRAIREFHGTVVPDAAPTEDTPPKTRSSTAIIVFTDIADSTALTESLGDIAFRAASRTLDEAIRRAMREASGTPVDGKVLGDGVLGVFSSAAQAIEAAHRCVAASSDAELPLHIGIHAGDVIHEDDGNVYGGAVNIAARICGLCRPGDILVSDTVRGLARTSAGVHFEDRGAHEMKGVGEAVRVYAVRQPE